MKHPLIAPMIFLLSIESFATEARLEKNLEVLNGNNFAATSSAVGKKEKIPGFMENADAFELCRAIRLTTTVGTLSGLIRYYARKRDMTVPHFINNVLTQQNCGGETDRYNIVTYTMKEEWVSFKTLVNDGLDVNQKLRDTDGLQK